MVNIMQVKYFDMHYVESMKLGDFAVEAARYLPRVADKKYTGVIS